MPSKNNNIINFQFNQIKLFNLVQYQISDDDPVRKLSDILEVLDFGSLMQVFPYKTKVHPICMFAVVLYAYSRGITSTREIERACQENIKFRYLLQNSKLPDHSTISRFLTKICNILPNLFEQFVKKLFELDNISADTIYIDGTKIEAYANKYTFVWKKSIQYNFDRLNIKIDELVSNFNKEFSANFSSIKEITSHLLNLKIHFVTGRGNRKSKQQKYLELCQEYSNKYEEYIKHLENLGDRNSYSKTDKDATFMRMKEDYMKNGQLKPGYNLQIGVISEYICSYEIFNRPSDSKTLIPFLEKISASNLNIKNIVADAGYESLENYEFLEKNNYLAYIKPIYFQRNKRKKFKKDLNRIENLIYDEEKNKLTRKDGLELEYLHTNEKTGIKYFFNSETKKRISYNARFRKLSNMSQANISSEYGKQLRMNRSIQVEGAFAVLKENMKLRKLKVRGKNSTTREICFFSLAYNFNRYLCRARDKKKGTTLHTLKIA